MKKRFILIGCLMLYILLSPLIGLAGEEERGIDAQLITAIFTVVIALVALIVAVWQAHAMRIHNRLSVKPHLVFDRISDTGSLEAKIVLSNNGVGPAIIKDFSVQFDGSIVQLSGPGIWEGIMAGLGIEYTRYRSQEIEAGSAMKIGDKINILGVVLTGGQSTDFVHEALCRINVFIKYESIYGEDFEIELNSDLQNQS